MSTWQQSLEGAQVAPSVGFFLTALAGDGTTLYTSCFGQGSECTFRSFFAQVPIVLGCLTTAIWQSLPTSLASGRKKRHLDMLGLVAFALMMSSFLLFVDFAGKSGELRSPVVITLAVSFVFSGIAFLLIEVYWANSPMIAPSLLKQANVGSYFAVQILLLIAQFAVSVRSLEWLMLKACTDGFQHCIVFCSH